MSIKRTVVLNGDVTDPVLLLGQLINIMSATELLIVIESLRTTGDPFRTSDSNADVAQKLANWGAKVTAA